MRALSLAVYALLTWLLQPLLRWKLQRRGRRESGYLDAVEERFGHYEAGNGSDSVATGPCIWVHAVSMGETRAAATLIEALRGQWPGMQLLLTNSTATGRAEGLRLLQKGDRQVWQPWDSAAAVNRFLQEFKPRLGILLETEIWPQLLAACKGRGIPVALVNARLNPRSLRLAERMAWLSRPAYEGLAMVLAQTEEDAQRLRQLGARVHGVYGNLKFDAAPNQQQMRLGQSWRLRSQRPLLMFASSREGEEVLWLRAWSLLARSWVEKGQHPRWLIVPRHPQRFDQVAAVLAAGGLSLSRRSQWNDGPDEQALACDVWLGDSLGEMSLYFALSEAALLGGSFEPLGGQNLIEAAACGCPLVMGPHVFNFAEAARHAVASGAALQVSGMESAMAALEQWLEQPQQRLAAVQACARFTAANGGSTDKTVLALASLLPPPRA